jgi:hypothetical protein
MEPLAQAADFGLNLTDLGERTVGRALSQQGPALGVLDLVSQTHGISRDPR